MRHLIPAILAALPLFAIAPAHAANIAGGGVTFRTDFECALQHPVTYLGGSGGEDDPVCLKVEIPGGRQEAGFFAFRLDGAAGKLIRIDIHTDRARNWGTLNPVFAYIWPDQSTDEALGDPGLFACLPPPDVEGVKLEGLGGSDIPLTHIEGPGGKSADFQRWRYMPRSGRKGNVFRVEHAFPPLLDGIDPSKAPSVVVAMKVPYTPKLCDALMADLQERWDEEFGDAAGEARERRRNADEPDWKVVQIATSAEGRPLWLVRIGKAFSLPESGWSWMDDSPLRAEPYISRRKHNDRPVILFYAREHADEHDTSWVAQGVIDYLLSDNRDARAIRKRCTVLVIPLLDPDGAVANQYETDVIRGFEKEKDTPETLAFGTFIRDWVDAGNRLDVVINLHNVESAEGMHLFPYMYDPRRPKISQALHQSIVAQLKDDYMVSPRAHATGLFRHRFGGWLNHTFGTHMMFYEVNSQAPRRHLSLYELKALGVGILKGTATYLYSPKSRPLRRELQEARQLRYAQWERYGYLPRVFPTDLSMFEQESTCGVLDDMVQYFREERIEPNWLRPLYDKIQSGELPPRPPWRHR